MSKLSKFLFKSKKKKQILRPREENKFQKSFRRFAKHIELTSNRNIVID
jgi:hypothetical protein